MIKRTVYYNYPIFLFKVQHRIYIVSSDTINRTCTQKKKKKSRFQKLSSVPRASARLQYTKIASYNTMRMQNIVKAVKLLL